MAYTAETIQTHTKIASAWANKIEQELATVGNYLGRVATKGLLNGLSADYKDFAWVDDEQAFYWYAGNGWFPYDVKRLKEGFTLVNMLGSYGGFEKDSDGDGVANGWEPIFASGMSFSLSNHIQNIQYTYANTYGMAGIRIYTQTNAHKYFFSVFVNKESDDTTSEGDLFIEKSASGTVVYDLVLTRNYTTSLEKYYTSYTPPNNILSNRIRFTVREYVNSTNNYANFNVKSACLYDLTWMDQYSPMPQSLQEKYSVSKWVDMTDDDLANELPYVDGVAYVGVGL